MSRPRLDPTVALLAFLLALASRLFGWASRLQLSPDELAQLLMSAGGLAALVRGFHRPMRRWLRGVWRDVLGAVAELARARRGIDPPADSGGSTAQLERPVDTPPERTPPERD